MSTTLSSLIPDLRLELPGCLDLTITRELRNACREFCEKTGCWEVVLDSVTVTEGETAYTLTLPDDATLVSIVAVIRDGLPFTAYQYQLPELDFMLDEVPTKSGTLLFTALLMPTRTATTVPDILERDYWDGIQSLTLFRLMRQAGVPWGNPSMAAHYQTEARRLQGRAAARRWRERNGEPLNVRPQPFV